MVIFFMVIDFGLSFIDWLKMLVDVLSHSGPIALGVLQHSLPQYPCCKNTLQACYEPSPSQIRQPAREPGPAPVKSLKRQRIARKSQLILSQWSLKAQALFPLQPACPRMYTGSEYATLRFP